MRHGAPLAERFWAKVKKRKSGCWEWTSPASSGYGSMYVRANEHPSQTSHTVGAHRVSWFLHTGKWPTKPILHTCDNPPCVRPSHLYEETNQDNMRDRAILTKAKVRVIRRSRLTNKALAKKFGVSKGTVQQARTGVTWSDIKKPSPVPTRRYEKWNA